MAEDQGLTMSARQTSAEPSTSFENKNENKIDTLRNATKMAAETPHKYVISKSFIS